jgi:hypothetical protein
MFKAIKEFFFGKPQAAPEAPYKLETPVFKPTADAAPIVITPVVIAPVAETKPARKPRANVAAKKIAAAKKPAARKPAVPKSPKAE